MIAIHNSKNGFHKYWVDYCVEQNITYKLVDCYANDIIKNLEGCNVLMWHHSHIKFIDLISARQLLNALQQTGMKIFPDFNTGWYFDDKIAQKYLLERIQAPMVKSYVFYNKNDAIDFIKEVKFPIVWKLRKGAGSSNVKLILNIESGIKLINKSFKNGFSSFNKINNFQEKLRKFNDNKISLLSVIKSAIRLIIEPDFSKKSQKEVGYIYFQDFIPNNKFDIRVITIAGKSFALKRYVRKNDFRASGSGDFSYDKEEFDIRCIQLSKRISKQLDAQCLAFDFVFDENNEPLIVEISYGFSPSGYEKCPGFWDENMEWIDGPFNPYGWMIDLLNI